MTIGRSEDWMECHDLLPPQKERVIHLKKRENVQSFWNQMRSIRGDNDAKLQEFAKSSPEKARGKLEIPVEEIGTGGINAKLVPKYDYEKETMNVKVEADDDVDVSEYILAKHNWWRLPFFSLPPDGSWVGAFAVDNDRDSDFASPEWSWHWPVHITDLPLIHPQKLKLYYLVPERPTSTVVLFALFPCKMDGIHTKKYNAFDRCIKAWTTHLRTKYVY